MGPPDPIPAAVVSKGEILLQAGPGFPNRLGVGWLVSIIRKYQKELHRTALEK